MSAFSWMTQSGKRMTLRNLYCCSVVQSCLPLWDLMDCSTPGFLFLHCLLEFAQIHVHWVDDAIQPSHPLFAPFSSCPQSFPASGSLQWVGSLHQVAKVLELQLQQQSFQWIVWVDFLQDWLVCSPCSPRDFQESSPKRQFKSINSSVISFLYGSAPTSIHDYWKNHSFD